MEVMAIPASRTRVGKSLLALCATALFLVFGTSAASAANNTFPFVSCPVAAPDIISPSCFEGGDGNLVTDDNAGDRIDWDRLVGIPHPATQYQDPRNPADDVFDSASPSGKEADPGGWKIESQSVQGKADILNTVFYTQLIPEAPGHIFFYSAFERLTSNGDVNVSFELNHGDDNNNGALTFDNDGNPATPEVPFRTENDVLITYDGNAGNVDIGLCYWHGDENTGNWFSQPNGGGVGLGGPVKTCPALPASLAIGEINASSLPNNVLSLFRNPIGAGNFGEVAVNLTDAIGAGNNLCFDFGGFWMHSRSSSQADSTMEDMTQPEHLNGANSCGQQVEKKVAVGAAADDPTTLTYADSGSVNDGDTLFYTLTFTNTGTQPITHEVVNPAAPPPTLTVAGPAVDDPNCESIATGDPGEPASGGGTATVGDDDPATADKFMDDPANPGNLIADSTPGSYDGGDVWVYRCKHLYNKAADGDPYVNTVTGDGDVGSFHTTQVTDHADVAAIAPGQLKAAKTVVGGAGGETWNFTINGVGQPTHPAIGDGDSTSSETVAAGTNDVPVVEGSQATGSGTFVITGISCPNATGLEFDDGTNNWHSTFTAGDDRARVDIQAGDDITCTFTNTKQARVRAEKSVVGGHGGELFDFTVAGTAEPAIAAKEDNGNPTAFETVTPNQATTISGDTLDAAGTQGTFDLTDVTCTGTNAANVNVVGDVATITPGPGEDVTCTYTNTREATVKAAKVVSSGKGGESFPLTVDGTTTPKVLSGGSTPAKDIVPANPITVSEGAQDGGPPGTFVSAVSCVDGQGGLVTVNSQSSTSINITPGAGQDITCTFTNRRNPDPPPPPPGGGPAAAPNPKVSIDKVGPAQALAGDAIQYGIAVKNTGDVSFPEQNVVLTDALCSAPPTLVGKLGDLTPATLDPGETWGYSCTVQTAVGQDAVHNIASVDAATLGGVHVTASDPADTVLVQPQQGVQPETIRPASARLQGPKSCLARKSTRRATVTGKRIASVTFLIDGKAVKTIKASKSQTSRKFQLTLDARRFNFDKHTVTARVTFLAGSNLKTKTLKLTFARCVARAVRPQFTG